MKSMYIDWLQGVASFTDAWIETLSMAAVRVATVVASFTDAWIETAEGGALSESGLGVASFTDAWIETATKQGDLPELRSHLLQMRGLKQQSDEQKYPQYCRIFYRCVD